MSSQKFKIKLKSHVDETSFQCFETPRNVELKEHPTNGQEYLLKVIKERENYPELTECKIDSSKYSRNQSRFVREVPHAKAPPNLKPTIEWQNIQVADFSETRMYISRLLLKKSLWPENVTQIEMDHTNGEEWARLFESREPTLSCALGLNHKNLDYGLKILIKSLNEVKHGHTISRKTGQWIYALLACTRLPLLSDTASLQRILARKCAEIRSHLNVEDESAKEAATPLNVFICLVARYFRQYDLAD